MEQNKKNKKMLNVYSCMCKIRENKPTLYETYCADISRNGKILASEQEPIIKDDNLANLMSLSALNPSLEENALERLIKKISLHGFTFNPDLDELVSVPNISLDKQAYQDPMPLKQDEKDYIKSLLLRK